MTEHYQGAKGWRNSTTRDRRYQPPRMTPLQIAGEVVGWLMIAAVLIGGVAYLEALFGAGSGQ